MTRYQDELVLKDGVTDKINKINRAFHKLDDKMSGTVLRLNKFNDRLQRATTMSRMAFSGIRRLATGFIALAGASGAITMGINKVVEFGDRVDKMSQKIGMSRKAYQEWNYIMAINGGNVDQLKMGFKTLTTQIGSNNKGFAKLGVKLKNNNGTLRSAEDIFNDTVSSLQKMNNVTERNIIGSQLFGRAFMEMQPLLNQSAEATEKLRKKFHKLGMELSDNDIKNAVEFKDTMTTLQMFMNAQMNKALVKLMPQLQQMADKFMANKDAIQRVVQVLGDFSIKVFKFIDFLTTHKEILAGILSIIVGLGAVSLYVSIVTGISMMTAAMAEFGVTSNLALGGIPIILGAIVMAITYLGLHWKKIWKMNVDTVKWCINAIVKSVQFLLDVLHIPLDLIQKLASTGLGKFMGYDSKSTTNNTQNNRTTNNTVTNNNYYGNTYNNMMNNVGLNPRMAY